jgi:hypothetical protein
MIEPESEEFYVGYQQEAPSGVARLIRRVIVTLLAISVIVSVTMVIGQTKFPASFFEFGREREFVGTVRERPFPMLLITRPGATGTLAPHSRYTLVSTGKHGATNEVRGFEGRRVSIRGSLVYRDGETMIEVAPGSLTVIPSAIEGSSSSKGDWLGVQTLVGEIVDSKCYLGVMNPGEAVTHRECAIRCISGGIPPLFIVHNDQGETSALWLISVSGKPVGSEVLDLVATPVEITGEVKREGDQLYIRADPSTYRRL